MADKDRGKHASPGLTAWERQLVFVIARKFELREPEELQAELDRTVLDLKARPPSRIADWKNYLAKALHNRANNWVRDRRAKAQRETALPESGRETSPLFSASEADPVSQVAFADLWQNLSPELKELWELLDEKRGNLTQVARRLRVHRNTVRMWIRKIHQILQAHGYVAGAHPMAITTTARPRPNQFVVLSSRLLQAIAHVRLSGTQWRILLWVMRETARRKQKMAPFRWSGIAKELSLDRGGAWRAGRSLSQAKLVLIQNGRIGLQREFAHPRMRRN